MLSKNARPYDPEALPPQQRLRANISDLYASNEISARRTQDAHINIDARSKCGGRFINIYIYISVYYEIVTSHKHIAQEMIDDIARANGSSPSGTHACSGLTSGGDLDSKNLRRRLNRKLLKGTMWPQLYTQNVRLWDPKAEKEFEGPLSFLLPHELVDTLLDHSDVDAMLSTARMDAESKAHLAQCEQKAGSKLLGLGIWGDGVPCQWDRSESVEAVVLNLPGLSKEFGHMRLPITALPKCAIGPNTWHDVFTIIKESFVALAVGVSWTTRADGTAFGAGDFKRKRRSGKKLRCRAALVEIRGDWDFLHKVFNFPSWRNKAGCCWMCKCTPDQVACDYIYGTPLLARSGGMPLLARSGAKLLHARGEGNGHAAPNAEPLGIFPCYKHIGR